jgi:Fic family protein
MEVERFRNSPIGSVVPISGTDTRFGETYEHWAFVPLPLPGEVDLSPTARDAVTEAALALGRLDQAGMQIPNPALLRRPTLRREAQSTSALEGTYAPLTDVFSAEDSAEARTPELREILNYVAAAEYAYQWVGERGRITRGLICELHALLMRGSEADAERAGMVRDIQVVIGSGGRIAEARFVPPPPGQELDAGLTDLLDWINRPRSRPGQAVVDSALAHYQFETLHPFQDGNGRIGRLLIVLQLLAGEVLSEPLFAVSPWFEARRAQYQDELLHMSMTGDVDRWVSFFCEGIRAQAQATVEKITDLLEFRQEAMARARRGGRHSVGVDIAGDLVERPVLNVSTSATRYDVSFVAANNAVAKLVDVGLLVEITGRGHDRVFRCDRVLQILER